MVMPSITICTFLTLTNSFKLFDQNLALTNGEPSNMSELLALNIFRTFYGRTGWVVSGERWDERGVPIGLGGFVLALRGFGRWVAGMSGLGQSWGFYSILCPLRSM